MIATLEAGISKNRLRKPKHTALMIAVDLKSSAEKINAENVGMNN